MKIVKKVLSIMMALISLVSVVSISAEALTVKVEDRNYGYMVPVNNKGTKVLSTVKLYGSYDYLNFFIRSDFAGDVYFFYEVYSDKKLTKCVDSGYTVCYYGDYNMSKKIKLEGKYKSKTYYAVTYAGMFSSNKKKLTVDENSLCQFEIVVDRSPSYDEKKVVLKSTSNTADGPKITWSKISGTSKYYIYRRSITGTKFKKVGSVSGKKSSFVDTSVKKKDGNYIYTVKGINKKGVASQYHYSGITCLYAETPTITSVKLVADNVIKLEWKKTDSDAIYYIYRKEIGGDWKKLDTDCPNNYYSDITAENGKEYMYRVKSVIKTDYGKAISPYYVAEKKTVKFLEAPIMNDLEITESGIGLSWRSVDGALGYSVLRKTLGSDEDWAVLGYVPCEQTSFVDETASLTDGAYLYTVRSEGDGFSGSYSSGKEYFTLKEPEFTVDVDEEGIYLKWEKVPYATSYRVLEQNAEGDWVLKDKTKKTSFSINPNSYYNKKLTVMACRTGDIYSTYKTDVEPTAYFPELNMYITELKDCTEIGWGGTVAQDSFRLYRKLTGEPDSAYELCYEGTEYSFRNTDVENDVSYTYQARGVYDGVEQFVNLNTASSERYSTEKYIKSFYVRRDITESSLYKGKIVKSVDYIFMKERTDAGKNLSEIVYYKSEGDWYQVCKKNDHILAENLDFADSPITFSYAVEDKNGSTPVDGCIGEIRTDNCAAPKLTIKPTKSGYKISWDAVEGAVSYEVSADFKKKTDYKKTVKADGSATYSVSLTDVEYNKDTVIKVTAVHKNGNKTTRRISNYRIYKAPELVKAGAVNDTIKFVWDAPYYDFNFAIMRKAEGEKEWTVLSKKYLEYKEGVMINGKEYEGFVYTDKKAKKGVKYTYTVRWYDTKTNEYASYYNTKGVSAKR